MLTIDLSRILKKILNLQNRNISDKKPTTTIKTYLSVVFWLASIPLCAQVPTITSFSPSSGAIGTSVIISGANFDTTPANNTVFFGATEATVTAAAADQLTVQVPAGTTYTPITVLVNCLVGYSSAPFVVTFSSPVISATSYAPLETFTTASSPRGLAIGDLNDDGKPDLVTVNGSSYSVSVLKNISTSGTIAYDPKVDFAAGTNPSALAVSDLDGDGQLDLVVANQSDNTLSVYRNVSTGGAIDFATSVDFTTGSSPYAIAIGDLDGDGKSELIVANRTGDNVSVLRNTSVSGTIDANSFASKVDFTVGSSPYAVAIGDLDGDSKVDLVVANRGDNTVSTLINSSMTGVIDASSFAEKVDHSTGTRPNFVALGDLDGDGKADLAITNISQQTVSVMRNTSTGAGAISYSRVDYTTGSSPASVAIVDMDGDGKPDLAVANRSGNSVSVFKNQSISGSIDANSFAVKEDYTSGYYPSAMVLGDQDGDHKPEIVVTNQLDNAIAILRHTGSDVATDISAFSLAEQTGEAAINATAHTVDIEVEYGTDVTALVATFTLSAGGSAKIGSTSQVSASSANDFTNPIVYTITAGDATTTQDWTVTITTEPPSTETDITAFSLAEQTNAATIDAIAHTVDIEVFSGIDLTDLVSTFSLSTEVTAATVGAVAQVSGTTSNDFTNPVTYTVTAEDETTSQDWVITVVVAAPAVAIQSFVPASGPVGTSVVISGSSFDATPANNVVYFGATKATVSAASSTELTVTVPVGATYKPITVLTNGLIAQSSLPFEVTFESAPFNAYSFAPKIEFATNSSPDVIEIGDLDNDAKPDLAIANSNGSDLVVSLFKNTSVSGNINFAPEVELTTGAAQLSVAMGDLDGDGKLDLAAVIFSTNTVSVFRNISVDGTLDAASFAAKVDYETGTSPRSVAIGDLDGDGKLDLAVANRASNTVSVFENTSSVGVISFAEKVDYSTGNSPYSIVISDLDNDERPELVVPNRLSNSVSIFKNTSTVGTISYSSKVDFDTGADPEEVAVGDLDGDDKPDLAVVNLNDHTVSVLMNSSTGGAINTSSFAAKVDFTTGTSPRALAIGDLDGDGKQELVIANDGDNTVSVLKNTSSVGVIDATSFASKIDFETETGVRSVAIGDLDGDGISDLVVGNDFSASLYRHTISETDILTFSLPNQTGSAVIDVVNHTIAIEIDFTPDVSALIPTFTLSAGASVVVNGQTQISGTTAVDFADPVTYTVTAEDNTTTQDWVVTVSLTPNTETDISSFNLPNQAGVTVLDASAHTVDIEVPFGTDVSSLTPTFTLSYGATASVSSVNQISEVSSNDFTNPLIYSIMAEDGMATQDWTVTVTVNPASDETDITAFTLPNQTKSAQIDAVNHKVDIEIKYTPDVSSLISTYSLSVGATARVNSTTQISGSSTNDFSNPVIYTITAENGSTAQDWEVSVTVRPNGIPSVSLATFTVDEDAKSDEFVGQVTATDPDDDDLSYSIKSGNEGNVFKMDQNTGEISVRSPLDFETKSSYSLVVEVEDANGGAATASITINLNDVDETQVLEIADAFRFVDVYPNPVSNHLTIQWKHFDLAILRDFLGREILQSSQIRMDLRNLPAGMYFLTLKSKANEQVDYRIIKE